MARAKIWMPSETHCDSRVPLHIGEEVAIGVALDGARLYMPMWGRSTTVHGLLVGIEWHEVVGDPFGASARIYSPGIRVENTDDFTHDVVEYEYELTVATNDWLPHS
jgi:hypothetical protein